MTEITMYDYILEEKDVLLNILQKRKTITRPFCTLLQEKNVDELVLCGSGTSYHAALAARRVMENLLQIRVRADLECLVDGVLEAHVVFNRFRLRVRVENHLKALIRS